MSEPLGDPDVQVRIERGSDGFLRFDRAGLLASCGAAVAAVAADPGHRIVVQVTLRRGGNAERLAGFLGALMTYPEVASVGLALAEPVDETVTEMRVTVPRVEPIGEGT